MKYNVKNIFSYIQGNVRYKLFYSDFLFLIPKHIREQIECRIKSMDKECYNSGQCKMCGCTTTALQMANKACEQPCYPRMLSKKEWKYLNKVSLIRVDNIVWLLENNKFEIGYILKGNEIL